MSKYILAAFPYPSGSGLHIGHAYAYSITDSYCRFLRHSGEEVFQPIGWDSHGLPTEMYAKKVGREPYEVANENIENFRQQFNKMDTQYTELVSTCEESYIKWTQWIFTKLKEHNLAYKKFGDVNWCESCETVIANEQVKDGSCEKCGSKIVIKQQNQWYFKITDYRQRLIDGLNKVDYPESVKRSQRNWLENMHDWSVGRQRKFGAKIPIEGEADTLDTFVDSSFYFIRYCDPFNNTKIADFDKIRQVDVYCCGAELSTNHLIYARFINMFLYDIGVTPFEEPFKRVICNGMIVASDGQKMSKSRGNVVNPDEYDSDTLRFYLMFIAHFFDGGSWSDKNINGITKFINRFLEWISREGTESIDFDKFKTTVYNYSNSFKFNKVVSEFMTLVKSCRHLNINSQQKQEIITLLEVYMPGIKRKII